MTVDELIAEVNNRHLRLNNLFQLENGRWQANITDGARFWEFGRGDTAVEALLAALHVAATTEPELGIDKPIRSDFLEKPSRARVVDRRTERRIEPVDVPFLDI